MDLLRTLLENPSIFLPSSSLAREWLQTYKNTPWSIVAAIIFVFGLLVSNLQSVPEAKIPFVGLQYGSVSQRKKKYVSDAGSLIMEGYQKFQNGLFQMTTTEGTRIVAGRKFYDALCDFKDDELSFKGSISDLFATHYTGVLISDELKETAIDRDLTRSLARLTATISDEVDYALNAEIGDCPDWKPVVMNKASQRMIALVTARVFVGKDLCHNEDWLHVSVNYWMDAFSAAQAIKFFPVWLRFLASRCMPQVYRMRAARAKAQELVIPILKKRIANESIPGYQKPDDMMQWMADRLGEKRTEFPHQAHLQLALAMGAIHSTNFTMLHELFDLAAYPEYHQPLRDEFNEALASTDGVLTKVTLSKLLKLDSFMKESQRYNPPGLTNGRRKTLKDLFLPGGTMIPKGSNMEMPAGAVNRDPMIYPNPEEFDGYRFYKLRLRSEEDLNKFQFVSSTRDSLNWGYGRHACPGRFFAADEVKVILSKLLQKYDLALVDPKAGRYKNSSFETMVIPDMGKEVLFRERKE